MIVDSAMSLSKSKPSIVWIVLVVSFETVALGLALLATLAGSYQGCEDLKAHPLLKTFCLNTTLVKATRLKTSSL